MRNTRHPWSWTLALILLAPWLLGTTYKWVDAQGQVHFTDAPPPAGTAYEVMAAPRSPSGSPPVLAVPPPASPAEAPAPAVPTFSVAADVRRDDARCVDALMQLQVLAGDWKVYKPGPGDDRRIVTVRRKSNGSPASATQTAAMTPPSSLPRSAMPTTFSGR